MNLRTASMLAMSCAMWESTSLALQRKRIASGHSATRTDRISSRASWKFADSGRVRSPRPRVSRIFISPRGLGYEYQAGRPVSERTEPVAATLSPKMALISEDLPAPRRPRIISFGGLASMRSSLRITSSFFVVRPSDSGSRAIACSDSSEMVSKRGFSGIGVHLSPIGKSGRQPGVILVTSTEALMNVKFARFTLALSLALLLAPFVAEAKPPKKPRPPKPGKPAQEQPSKPQGEPARAEQTPPAGLDGVDERLWHYQTGAARDALGRFMDQADANAYVALAYGRVLDQEKKYGDAEGRLRKATELAPNDPAPFVYLGESYYQQRREGDANNAFRKAAEVAQARGGSAAAYYLGVAQSRLKQYDAAVATLEGAQAPQPALLPYQIGVARFGQGNWSAAAEQLNHAIDMDSGLA